MKSKRKHLQSKTHDELEESIRIKHATEDPDFFDMDEIFNEYINNHNKSAIQISLNMIWF